VALCCQDPAGITADGTAQNHMSAVHSSQHHSLSHIRVRSQFSAYWAVLSTV